MCDFSRLLERARRNRDKAYAPYSGYSVGAALLCCDGEIFDGANIENAAYTPGLCAERAAFAAAVLAGKRDFAAIGVSGGKIGKSGETCFPCGVCRQFMCEFAYRDDFYVIVDEGGCERAYPITELLPNSFTL